MTFSLIPRLPFVYTTNMPKFAAQHLLSDPMDRPELPPGDYSGSESTINDPQFTDYDPVRDLLSWQAPARPHMKRTRSFYTTVATLVILLSCIALFFQEWLLIGA